MSDEIANFFIFGPSLSLLVQYSNQLVLSEAISIQTNSNSKNLFLITDLENNFQLYEYYSIEFSMVSLQNLAFN
jgi:hypothetical protein